MVPGPTTTASDDVALLTGSAAELGAFYQRYERAVLGYGRRQAAAEAKRAAAWKAKHGWGGP